MNKCATHTITKKKYEGIFPRKNIFNVIVNVVLNFNFSFHLVRCVINRIFEAEKIPNYVTIICADRVSPKPVFPS